MRPRRRGREGAGGVGATASGSGRREIRSATGDAAGRWRRFRRFWAMRNGRRAVGKEEAGAVALRDERNSAGPWPRLDRKFFHSLRYITSLTYTWSIKYG